MSADNWALCPKCEQKIKMEREQKIADLHNSYGKVSEDEYLKMKEASTILIHSSESLEENYSLGISISKGKFEIDYRAECLCGFVFEFKCEKDIKI